MKAVIMAGGKGSRLRPLTCTLPKPMMPVMNKPLMLYTIELLKKYGITDIAVTLQHLPKRIEDYFGEGEELGVNLTYFEEHIPLGTAGGVRNAADFLDETFVVISGDALTDFDLKKALDFHREKKGMCTLLLTRVDNPLEFGVCTLDGNNRITRYLEKPGWGEVFSDTVNTGIYIMEPEIFDLYPQETFFDYSRDLFPLMLEKDIPLYGFTARGYWSDIGDLGQYRQTHMDILQGKIDVPLEGTKMGKDIWVGENTRIDPQAEVKGPIFVGNNCTIKNKAVLEEYTVMGDNNTIEEGATLKRSLLWNHNYVGPQAELRGTIIGSQCVLKAKATLLEGSIVADHCSLGVNSTLEPDVKLWPRKKVEDNSTVNTSLVWREKVGRHYFGLSGIWGIPNVEITPEFVVKLAAAYGTVLEPGMEIAVSSDRDDFAQVLKRAFCAGLLSTGINTVDIGTATAPVNRYAVRVLSVQGGAHIRLVEEEDFKIMIEFLDEYGINAPRGWERKIENSLQQEEFRRVNFKKMGEFKYMPQLTDAYVERIVRTVQADLLRRKYYRLVVDYDYDNLSSLIMPLLEKLGCQVISLTRQEGPAPTYTKGGVTGRQAVSGTKGTNPLQALADSVVRSNADLGVSIDRNGERITLVTEKGEILSNEIKTALNVISVLSSSQQKKVGAPVSAPSVIEKLAEKYKGEVVRTRVSPRSVMEVVRDNYFQLHFDALYSLVLLLDHLARRDMRLSQVVDEIPSFSMYRLSLPTSWSEIGRIMGKLFDELKDQKVETIDGIKIFHQKGWTLIIPDANEPAFNIISESSSPEEAKKLASHYADMIKELQAEGGNG